MDKNNLMISEDYEFTHDDLLSVSRRCHYNEYIAEFYERFAGENEMPIATEDGNIVYGKDKAFLNRAKGVKECCGSWTFDFYPTSKVKNLIRVNRCKDRFCLNCQALVADQRYFQYQPILDAYREKYDLYHVVLTVPNVEGSRVADTVTIMLDRFSYMIRYFDGRKNIRGLDMLRFGFVGAVRSLEITINRDTGTFHPHLHCIFILKKNMSLPQCYFNRYSVNSKDKEKIRLFSELDLIFQRIWCLLILKIKVTKYNLEHMSEVCDYPDGFSCRADLSNGKYHEIFKYAIKGTFKEKTLFKYEHFLILYKALFGRRIYETYGDLRKYDFNEVDESLGFNSKDRAFEMYLSKLQELEVPQRIEEQLFVILKLTSPNGKKEFKYISKATFVNHFKSLSEEDKELFMKEMFDVEYN